MLVADLNDPVARDRQLVGGKAASLAALMQAGLPVPGGFCITTNALSLVIDNIDIEVARSGLSTAEAKEVHKRIASAELPSELEQQIEIAYHRLGGDSNPVAVRSSAIDEDQGDASYAGQYETSLGITDWPGLVEAVSYCWASLYSKAAVAYRAGLAKKLGQGKIAVLVQRLIDADVSGVVFTCDPATGDSGLLVNASWGLGEAVVSGWVTPDHYRLDRSGALLDSEISTKHVMASALSPGERIAVAEEITSKPCLDRENLRRLAELALQAEEIAGTPQDIEFAISDGKLWLLQSRPITTIAPEPLLEPGMQPREGDHWTRAIADEYWADAVTPLSFSSLGSWIDRDTTKAMDRIMGFNQIDPSRPTLRLFRSHAYWNADVVAAGFKYVPASARTEQLLAYFPPEIRLQVTSVPTAWLRRLRGEVLMRLRDRSSSIKRNHRALESHARQVRQECARLDGTDLENADRAELDRYWQTVDRLGREHFKIIRWGMQQHSLTFNFLLAKLLEDWLDDDGRLFNCLIGGANENLTLETNRQIWKLARLAEKEPDVKSLLERLEAPAVEVGADPQNPNYEKLVGITGEGAFAQSLREFLDRYGHRGFSRDIGLPRWIDQPDTLLFLVAQALGVAEDPALRTDRERLEREAAEKRLRVLIGSGIKGRMRHKLLRLLLPLARTYTAFRENQRFTLDLTLLRARRAALAYGRLLVERGAINCPGDVFYLTLDEVQRALDGDLEDPSVLASTRHRAYLTDSRSLPPMYMRGNEAITTDAEAGGDTLSGMPVSGGRITARCCVARNLDEAAQLKDGKVLVASNLDPGWTPLLTKVGGLVLETGGVLAHGAIVAREYGIPAVTAVSEATQRINDGELVTVDGWIGTVEFHRDDRPNQ